MSCTAEPALEAGFLFGAPPDGGGLPRNGGGMQENGFVTVNGKQHPHTAGMTVSTLLAEVLGAPGTVVVELNAAIIPRGAYDETPLNAGDSIEIVHFVGGG